MKHLSQCALLVALLYVPVFSHAAAKITISQSLDKSAVAFEEKPVLTIELTWNGPQHEYLFTKPLRPTLDRLKVASFSTSLSANPTASLEATTKTFRFELEPTSSGTATIEPITVSYIHFPDSVPGELTTEPLALTVAEPKAPQGRGKGPELMSRKALIIAGITLFLSVSFTIILVLKSRKPKATPQTPAQQFLHSLAQMKQSADSDVKRFQAGLYKLLVWYLHAQYGLDPSPKPTEEIVRFVDSSSMPSGQKEQIGAWLLQAHRMKFSPAQPAPGEITRLESEVRQFFEKI